MRIVVTGAAGFIGSSLTFAALELGHQVLAIDKDFSSTYAVRNFSRNQDRCDVLEVDLAQPVNASALQQSVRSFVPNKIVHLAAYAGVRASMDKREEYLRNNVLSTITSLELAADCDCDFLLASTSSLYTPKSGPTHETDGLSTKHPYALSKLLSEQVAYGYKGLIKSIRILRFFTVFGPFGRTDMMPGKLLRASFSGETVPLYDPQMKRDWTYIDDLINRILAVMDVAATSNYEVVNMGSGRPTTLGSFISTFEQISGRKIMFEDLPTPQTEALQTWASVENLSSIIGDLSYVPLEEALAATWNWATSINPSFL